MDDIFPLYDINSNRPRCQGNRIGKDHHANIGLQVRSEFNNLRINGHLGMECTVGQIQVCYGNLIEEPREVSQEPSGFCKDSLDIGFSDQEIERKKGHSKTTR